MRTANALVRWNLFALMLDVAFFSLGMAFFDQNAVLPLLLTRLGASGPLIGAFAAARFLMFSLFQMFVAYGMHGRPRQKPWLALVAALSRLPLLALPWFLWRSTESPGARGVALISTITLMTFWAMGDGLGYVPWMEIVARSFSERTRGRFFASSQLISGIASILIAAFVVTAVLHSPRLPFPHNYAVLAGAAAIMFQISLLGILLIREPIAENVPSRSDLPTITAYFRRLPGLVGANPIFARLAAIQLLIGFGSAAAPFYVVYASERFNLSDAWAGRFQVLQAIGVVVLMPLWAFLTERRGPGAAVHAVALTCFLTPVLALTVGTLSPWLFGIVFLLMGGSLSWGLWITLNHYLLTHITDHERPIYVALMNLLFVPSALYPFLGGLLVARDHLVSFGSVPVLFVATGGVTLAGLLLSLRLPILTNR